MLYKWDPLLPSPHPFLHGVSKALCAPLCLDLELPFGNTLAGAPPAPHRVTLEPASHRGWSNLLSEPAGILGGGPRILVEGPAWLE